MCLGSKFSYVHVAIGGAEKQNSEKIFVLDLKSLGRLTLNRKPAIQNFVTLAQRGERRMKI